MDQDLKKLTDALGNIKNDEARPSYGTPIYNGIVIDTHDDSSIEELDEFLAKREEEREKALSMNYGVYR